VSVLMIQADARKIPLADKSIHCVVTSPPYWGLRDYGVAGQIGLERTPDGYIAVMLEVFRDVKRVLRDDGTLWLNMGDCYHSPDRGGYQPSRTVAEDSLQRSNLAGDFPGAPNRLPQKGLKPKDLVGMPWRLAFALQADGWYLRSDIIWSKPNPMPESVTDRPTKAHEYIFLLSKSERYFYDADAIKENVTGEAHDRGNGVNPKCRWKTPDGWDTTSGNGGHGTILRSGREKGRVLGKNETTGHRRYEGFNERWNQREASRSKQNESFSAAVSGLVERRNKRTVWTVNPQPFPEAHFATFPEELIKPCILAGCPAGGTVLDPFMGSGTTALVARNLQCNAVGLELNAAYIEIAKKRLSQEVLSFACEASVGD
jgi:DNA modification methylase